MGRTERRGSPSPPIRGVRERRKLLQRGHSGVEHMIASAENGFGTYSAWRNTYDGNNNIVLSESMTRLPVLPSLWPPSPTWNILYVENSLLIFSPAVGICTVLFMMPQKFHVCRSGALLLFPVSDVVEVSFWIRHGRFSQVIAAEKQHTSFFC